jgi:hypothetical protein
VPVNIGFYRIKIIYRGKLPGPKEINKESVKGASPIATVVFNGLSKPPKTTAYKELDGEERKEGIQTRLRARICDV